MDGIKSINIKHFRGFEHLGVEDFARVNILVGQNNCGKSTVLEALLFITGMSNPYLPQNLNTFRSRNLFNGVDSLKYLFHNMDFSNSPHISATQFDGDTRSLNLSLTYKSANGIDGGATVLSTETKNFVNSVVLDFAISGSDYQSYLTLNSTGGVAMQQIPEAYFEKLSTALLPSDTSASNPIADLGEIFKRQQKGELISLLQKFDSQINAIEIINGSVFLGLAGMGELIPIALAGDGMKRYLNIISSAANIKTNIILIDEIDNGLHYSAYKKLWEALFALAVSTNKQIFVTTHSKETLQKLNEMLEERPEYQNEMALYTIEQTKLKGHQAYRYPYEGLAEACKNNVEIRSIAL
ncbi:MAG: AAA family ATPase [Bacteroidales bacterium]|nr:AAA family ATPase [Bacteroidales bacterium]